MSNEKKTEELITYSRVLYERKMIHATGGNTSVRSGDRVLISQTGAELGALARHEVVAVNLAGAVISGERPSKEMDMHLAMYRARSTAQAVIHAHPTYAIALSTMIGEETDDAVPPYTAAFYVRAGRVPMITYHPSGAASLHEAVAALASRHHAILLRQHGLIVAGKSMADALGIVEEIEQCCRIAVAVGTSGEALTARQRLEIDGALGRSW